MDWGWITAFVGVIGAVLGSLVTGLLNHWNTTRQLETQERIAAAARADDRVKLLLTERRALYGEVLDQARALIRIATPWASWRETLSVDTNEAWMNWVAFNEAGEPKEAWDEDTLIYDRMMTLGARADEARRSLSMASSGLELVAPPEVAEAARHLMGRVDEMPTADAARAELKRLDAAFTDFVRACRRDLGADPDDPSKALQTV